MRHNYQKEIERLINVGKLRCDPGEISQLEISHDRWCGVYMRDLCNCKPEIRQDGKLLNGKGRRGKHD